jgi:hypothetical protein
MTSKRVIHLCAMFVVSVVAATMMASVIGTQFVLARLDQLGVSVSLADRLATTWHDFINLGVFISPAFGFSYGILIATGLLVAFVAATVLSHWLPSFRTIIFTAAGGIALATVLILSLQAFEVMLFSFARSPLEFFGQVVAAACGGWLFATLTAKPGDA